MKRFRTLGILILPVLTLALLAGCKKKSPIAEPAAPAAPAVESGFQLKTCPVARIEITPAKSENEGVTIGSMAEVRLTAAAYDADGKELNVPLTWRFRHPDTCGVNTAGGHKLEVADSTHATFKATGLAEGEFIIIAEDQSCNLSTNKDKPMYVEGLSWVRVYNRPGAEVSCGRMRATYGDEVDRMSERTMASSKILLLAEITGPPNTPSKYLVKFYRNDKAVPELQTLVRNPNRGPEGKERRSFRAMLPLYLTPGDYCIRYELLKVKGLSAKEVVCGSGTERFTAR